MANLKPFDPQSVIVIILTVVYCGGIVPEGFHARFIY
jgi:hypothetical protein